MGWFSALVVFLISWWMVFLAVLPVGVKGQWEDGRTEDGTEPGAPVEHMLAKKFRWATIAAALITLIAFIVLSSGLVTAPDINWTNGRRS